MGMNLKTDTPLGEITADLETLIPTRMEVAKVPGLSIALIRDGELAWSRGFGVKSAALREPVTADTVFSAQSLSKPVFAYAVLKLWKRGLLDLDRPLTEYLPEPYLVNEPWLRAVSARHVLSHTTGFPNWRPIGKPLKILFTPGERFSYSGEGYVYLQRVVEHLTGEPLAEYMKTNLLEPFGMSRSSYVWSDAYEVEAEGHDGEGRSLGRPKYNEANAAASLYSTSTDYARFIVEILKPSGKDLFRLSEETIEEMLKPQVSVYFSISWGLGWGIEHSSYGDSFWQWGQGGRENSFQAFAVGFKKERLGAIVMTNSSNGLRICEKILVNAVGGEYPAFADYLKI
jgi:CubicO group peptidase (beta-lactamase class C family)